MTTQLKFKTPRGQQPPIQINAHTSVNLDFVNIENPEQIKERATQRKIRRHVMRDLGCARRKDTAQRGRRQVIPSLPAPYFTTLHWRDFGVCQNFERLFRAMDMVSEGLLTLAVADICEFRGKIAYGLDNSARQPLCNQLKFVNDMEEYGESVSLVRKSISRPQNQTTRHVMIGTIICLAYIDLRIGDFDGWLMHIQALQGVVALSGGLEILETCPPLRRGLFLADLLGSVINDIPPAFPLPRDTPALPIVSNPQCVQLLQSLESVALPFPGDKISLATIESALRSASQLAIVFAHVDTQRPMDVNLLLPVCTIAHNLVSLPAPIFSNLSARRHAVISHKSPLCAIGELVRQSVLSMLSILMATTSGDHHYYARHRKRPVYQVLKEIEDESWEGLLELRLWVLAIQTLMETTPARHWFLEEITRIMSLHSLQSWNDLMTALRQVVWIEKAAMQEIAQLKCDLESRPASITSIAR